jgi:hypothetical protein
MDILKTSTDWAKAEVFSTQFFIFFGVIFVLASIGFWQLGKSDMARAYIIPTLVAGALLLTIGLGLFFTNKARIVKFEKAYTDNTSAFIESEINRVESTIKEYRTVVFKAIPIIIALCALGIIFFNSPIVRASLITSIAMLVVILLIDGTAHSRIEAYNEQLVLVKEMKN